MEQTKSGFSLAGKVALVTGAARGIGAATAEALLAAGAKVMLSDVLTDIGNVTANGLAERFAGCAAFIAHDVTREDQWQAAIDATIDCFGGLDVLVNNAGIETMAFITDCTLDDFRHTQAVNVEGSFLGIKHAARAMRAGGRAGRGGSIINLSSVAGLVGQPTLGAYCASKGAVRLLSKAAAVEFARLGYGIRVNSIHPGVVKTDMGINVVKGFARLGLFPTEATADAVMQSLHPAGYGQPSDIANSVVFLASDAVPWMTGAELVVDGAATAN